MLGIDQESPSSVHKAGINANTGISIGIVVLIIVVSVWIIRGQADTQTALTNMKSDLSIQAMNTKNELSSDIRDLKNRMTNLESAKNSWSSTAMFRWAVHLQQLNKDPKKLQTEGLIVPEPEVDTK